VVKRILRASSLEARKKGHEKEEVLKNGQKANSSRIYIDDIVHSE